MWKRINAREEVLMMTIIGKVYFLELQERMNVRTQLSEKNCIIISMDLD